jgi:tetratricopeptide (TPR) repeat protein
MWKIATALVAGAAAWAGAAYAQDQQLRLGPAASWVQPAAAIKADSPDDGAAVRLLLVDNQLHFGPEGLTRYDETAVRVQTPQGLQATSTINLSWDPALGSLTVHKLVILRGGQTIDVLAAQKFTVLRREKNLEAQQLTGVLSAVIQPEDLRVGDVVDMAYSQTSKDPALAGHVQWTSAAPNVPIDDLRLRATSDQSLFWRATDGFDGLTPGVNSQGRSLSVAMTNVQPALLPNGAPARFRAGRTVQFGDFKSWAEVSAVMAPLFVKASTIGAESPLQAEIARIKASSPDAKARAQAALSLVQDQVRYILLTMSDGGYVPADADLTWKRRFGDCKAKTVLLLALLHGLGIEAQPVLVNSQNGDGLDERLPTVGAFDHVLVRANIGGRVYWLDGTRLGDRRLDDIAVPNMHWALPVQPSSATLVRLTPTLDKPTTVITIRLDASKGLEAPAAVHAEVLFRGDAGWALSTGLNNQSPAQREANLREFWLKQPGAFAPAAVSASFDPLSREERIVMDGTAPMTWDPGTNGGRVFHIDGADLGMKTDFNRAQGPHADAPFVAPYPAYSEVHEAVILPNRGQGFRMLGTDIDQHVAGRAISRKVSLQRGVFTADVVTQSLAPEFPASEAAAATQTFRDLGRAQVFITAPANYRMTSEDVTQYLKRTLTTPKDLMQRGEAMRQRGLLTQARADMERAIALDPNAPAQYADIAQLYAMQGDFTAAHEALKKGLALNPDGPVLGRAAGVVALIEARYDDAVAAFNKMLASDPNDRYAHRQRAVAFQDLGDTDKAAADADALLQANPRDADARQLKMFILLQAGKDEQALAVVDAGIALEPKSAAAHVLKGDALRILRRDAEAQAEFDAALALIPTVQGYLGRAGRRPVGDHQGRLKDFQEALKLDPDDVQALSGRAAEEALTGQFDAAIAHIDAVVAKNPDDVAPRLARVVIYERAGKTDLIAADLDWMRAHAEDTGGAWNSICSNEGRLGLTLAKAIADCDKGVSLAPRNAANLDGRALVLLRLGRLDEAIAGYDLALKLSPRQAESLYGRGLAKLGKGQGTAGQSDLAAARAIRPHVDDVFAEFGLKPPAAYAASTSATK